MDGIKVGGNVSFPNPVGRLVGVFVGIDADGGKDLGIDELGLIELDDGKDVLVDNIVGVSVATQVGCSDWTGFLVRSGFFFDSLLPFPFGLLPGVPFIMAFLGPFAGLLPSDDLCVRVFALLSRLFSQNKKPNVLYRCSHRSAVDCNDFLSCFGILERSFKRGYFRLRL
jgi:hypothetical protein